MVAHARADPRRARRTAAQRLDIAGAITVTISLMVAVYAIVNGNEVGWVTPQTLGLLAIAGLLLAIFVVIESRVASPLVPLRLFRLRNIAVSNVVGVLWAGSMFAWFFLSALYLQLVLGYSPLEVGLAFLPGNLIMGAMSIGLSAKLVMRFGIRLPLAVGLSLAGLGLLLFARAPVDGNFVVDVLPSMLLLGLGAGMAFNPVLLAAMSDVEPTEAGLASGVVNTSFMMGGALGLAVLASLAAWRTDTLLAEGSGELEALTGGYHVAFLVGAIFALAAAALGGLLLRKGAYAMPRRTRTPSPSRSMSRGAARRRRRSQAAMGKVVFDISSSLDGFVAGPNPALELPLGEGGEGLHEWVVGLASWRERHGESGGATGADDDILTEGLASAGAVLMGRRMFSGGAGPWEDDPNADGWWGDDPPFRVPVFVLTHHPREPVVKQGGTTFTFVTGRHRERGRAGAGGRGRARTCRSAAARTSPSSC